MFNSENFSYNGFQSTAMKVMLVKDASGFLEYNFGEARSLIEEPLQDISRPIFYGLSKSPLEFTLTVCSDNDEEWTTTSRKDLVAWLFTDVYADFISADNTDIVYRAIAVGQGKFYNNAAGKGYFTVNFRCDNSCGYLASAVSTGFVSTAGGATTAIYTNSGNLDYYPEMLLVNVGGTSITVNNSSNGTIIIFTGISTGEEIYIDNERMIIHSSLGEYRYNNFNKQWIYLSPGDNILLLTGDTTVYFRSAFPIVI